MDDRESSAFGSEIGEFPEGVTFPLPSRRVTLAALRAIGQALDLGLLGRSAKEEVLATIQGKLRETRECQDIQVIIQERDSGVNKLFLVDGDGVFLETEYSNPRAPARAEGSDHEGLVEKLQQEVEELNAALQESERQLREERSETERLRGEVERSSREAGVWRRLSRCVPNSRRKRIEQRNCGR